MRAGRDAKREGKKLRPPLRCSHVLVATFPPVRTALHEAVVRADLDVAAVLLANPSLSGLEAADLCEPDE